VIPVNGLVTKEGLCGGCGGSGLSPTYGDWHECPYCTGTGGWFEIVHVTNLDEIELTTRGWDEEDSVFVNQELTRRLINEIE
jgi:hypothetical protein